MVSEMTGSYSLLVPLMLACGLNMALSRRWTIYEEQVPTPIDSPAHQGDFVVDVLEQLRVGEVGVRTEGIETVPAATPFRELIHLVARSTETLFPVVDRAGPAHGDLHAPRPAARPGGLRLGPAGPGRRPRPSPVLTVTPEDNLHTALRRMTELNIDELPVVDPKDPTRLLGLLSRRQLTLAYTSLIESLRAPVATAPKPSPSGETAVRLDDLDTGRWPRRSVRSAGRCTGRLRSGLTARPTRARRSVNRLGSDRRDRGADLVQQRRVPCCSHQRWT